MSKLHINDRFVTCNGCKSDSLVYQSTVYCRICQRFMCKFCFAGMDRDAGQACCYRCLRKSKLYVTRNGKKIK
jgi:hypothetical protein